MPTYQDPFSRCKLCGQDGSTPTYRLDKGEIYRCPHCDFHFLNQLDGNVDAEDAGLSSAGRRYIESRVAEGEHLHPLRLRLVQQHCSIDKAMTLDIGAGLGQFVRLMQQQGATALGIEPSTLRRAYALEAYGLELDHRLADGGYWQNGHSQSFDLITLWDVIEHVDDPRSTLAAAATLLKPGGLICLDTPDREVFSYRLSQIVNRLSSGTLPLFFSQFYSTVRYGHKQIFTRRQITELLQDCGLVPAPVHLDGPAKRAFSGKIVLTARKPTPHSPLPTPHSPLPTPHSPLPTPHSLSPLTSNARYRGLPASQQFCAIIFFNL
ncbi:class I SAM-dependent methyltransferase [Pelovirga terrestris]|uniref:Methyltransferase domain-containing protein n=1 Tax=Pelovirga terrestris TaxID=2771352 RepID=A0A8J6QSR4_9BACT|nr:class I SAM-dependent methyltransferase [Pelovirga terrestris]MBD1401065.1 methyltransferase domain-containing protein [Pelovirga terrestris]